MHTAVVPTRIKSSSLGGEQDEQFEKNFASLAYSYVRDKAPMLMDHMVGFQLVERNEDDTKAAGVFGFQVNKQWFYVPVFFLTGKVKGHELLYMKNQDMFVPLKEAWINYLLHRKPSVLGNGTNDTISSLGLMQPDYRALAVPPGSKMGSERRIPRLHKWARESGLVPTLARWVRDKSAKDCLDAMLAKQAQSSRFNLEDLLSSHPSFVAAAHDLCQRQPQFKQALDKHYGPDVLERCLKKLAAQLDELPPEKLTGSYSAERPEEKVAFLTRSRADFFLPSLDESQRERLQADGYLVIDHRGDKEAASEYRIQEDELRKEMTNPSQTALYDVLLHDGSVKECLVIAEPMGFGDPAPGPVTVIQLEKSDGRRKWANANRYVVWAVPIEERKTDQNRWQSWFKNLTSEEDSIKNQGVYVAVAPGGGGTIPFRVHDDLGGGEYEVSFLDWPVCGGAGTKVPVASPPGREWSYTMPRVRYMEGRDPRPHCRRIKLSDSATKLTMVGGVLVLPKDAKFLQLAPPPPSEGDGPVYVGGYDEQELQFGDIKRLIFLSETKTARLALKHSAGQYSINGRPHQSKLAALKELVTQWQLREEDAVRLLKEASGKPELVTRIKLAQGELIDLTQLQSYGTPVIPEPPLSAGNPFSMGGPMQQSSPYEVQQALPSFMEQGQDNYWDPSVGEHPLQSQQLAQQAAGAGTRELFDTAAIGTLLGSVRQDSIVDRYLPDLFKALDSLGRLFVNFFWHAEEFEDRYGKQDLPELEDSIRNTFDSLGDVLLFLKQKTIDPFAAVNSEPDLGAAGRN